MIKKLTPFRCVAQDGWYFVAREGRIGPFETRREAEAEYQRYVCEMTSIHRRQQKSNFKKSGNPYRGGI